MRPVLLKHAGMALLLGMPTAQPVLAGDELPLVQAMGSFQYFGHKASLAIDKQNRKLTSFYVHEIEEVIESIEKIDDYKGKPVGELVRHKLVPPFEKLEDAIKTGDWGNINTRFNQLVEGCNLCHVATDHEYIKIVRPKDNPFMQSFETIK